MVYVCYIREFIVSTRTFDLNNPKAGKLTIVKRVKPT